jgi:hypothetical protein
MSKTHKQKRTIWPNLKKLQSSLQNSNIYLFILYYDQQF